MDWMDRMDRMDRLDWMDQMDSMDQMGRMNQINQIERLSHISKVHTNKLIGWIGWIGWISWIKWTKWIIQSVSLTLDKCTQTLMIQSASMYQKVSFELSHVWKSAGKGKNSALATLNPGHVPKVRKKQGISRVFPLITISNLLDHIILICIF